MRQSFRMLASAFAVAAASAFSASATAAQDAQPPEVGAVAPDFIIAGATRFGPLQQPVKLSDFRGQQVVLAFFPRARTQGCTVQLEKYRDEYATLFNAGKGVVVLAVSTDSVGTLAAWARDASFPFLMGSDADQVVGKAYGSTRGAANARNLFVIGPDGRITHRMLSFNVMFDGSYEELGQVVARTTQAGSAR